MSPAEEMRVVATRLREAPTGPAKASLDMCGHASVLIGDESIGGCPDCGTRAEIDTPELAALLAGLLTAREPLAALLEKTAKQFDEETYEHPLNCPDGTPGCAGHGSGVACHLCGNWVIGEDEACECFGNAIDVTRAINGAFPLPPFLLNGDPDDQDPR